MHSFLSLTNHPQIDEDRPDRMRGQLALVQAAIVVAHRLDAQRPMAHVPRMLHQKPLVAAVRRQADGQQLEVAPPNPGHGRRRRIAGPADGARQNGEAAALRNDARVVARREHVGDVCGRVGRQQIVGRRRCVTLGSCFAFVCECEMVIFKLFLRHPQM